MNPPENPYAPIPSPHGQPPISGGPRNDSEWQSAPPIVRGWARPLAALGIAAYTVLILVALFNDKNGAAEKAFSVIFFGAFLGLSVWLFGAIKRGHPAAYIAQIVLSAMGLLACPIGTLIHGYILSQWFKPEVKTWFRQR